MPLPALAALLIRLGGIAAALFASFTWGLPLLAALPAPPSRAFSLWCFSGPALGLIATSAFALLRAQRQADAACSWLAALPAVLTWIFGLSAAAGVALGLVLELPRLLLEQPLFFVLSTSAMLLAFLIALRILLQDLALWEMKRLTEGQASAPLPDPVVRPPARSSQRRSRPTLRAVVVQGESPAAAQRTGSHRPRPARSHDQGPLLAIRPAIALISCGLALISLILIVNHTTARSRSDDQALAQRHLAQLLQVATAQAAHLPSSRLISFFQGYPASPLGVPVLIDLAGKVASGGGPGYEGGAALQVLGPRCLVGSLDLSCATAPLADGFTLAVLQQPVSSGGAFQPDRSFWGLASAMLLFAGFLGWAVGNEISRDFQRMTNQLRFMARQDELELGHPITVTSIDEVGDLTAALGQLRHRLDQELSGYRESLRQAREADRIQNKFFADVSSELRSPLTNINGYSQLLLATPYGSALTEPQREDIAVIFNSGHHLLQLIKDIIDLSVIESGQLVLHLEQVNLVELCQDLQRGQIGQLRTRGGSSTPGRSEKNLKLELVAAEAIPPVIADPVRLRQIVSNLLSNAIKFTDAGQITIEIDSGPPDWIRLTVRDTGVGISAAEIPYIFDRFRQSGTTTMQQQGTGLGLGITQHLVELHGGTIAVSSEMGRGTAFTIRLPVAGPTTAREQAGR